MTTKNRKITVLLAGAQFEKFDLYCEQNGYKKSTLICKLIADLLKEEEIKAKVAKNQYAEN